MDEASPNPDPINRSAQSAVAPFAILLTLVLWGSTWVEILTHGRTHPISDLSKLYLGVMAAYAGAAEITKWLVNAPTNSAEDPAVERAQRGGVFIGLWLVPLLYAYIGQMSDPLIPMPAALERINMGLVTIFFLKMASRNLRHKKHGVVGGEIPGLPGTEAPEASLLEVINTRISASPEGMTIGEIFAAFPEINKPRLYRCLDKLVAARRLLRTGKPRTPEVRYQATTVVPEISGTPSQN